MWNNNIPRFQTGGQYIPGLESSIFGAKLDRSVADTREDLRNKAKRMKKGLFRGKIGKFLGKGAGKWLGKALTAGIAATNPLAALALSSGIAAGTQRLGEKIGRGKDVKLRNTSGLLGSQYDDLKDYQKGADQASKGAAWETFGEEIFGGLKSDYGQKIWGDQLSDDFKTKVFGDELGSKTHDELSKMNIGEMLGTKGAFFGAEDKLSDVGKEAYDWAGDKGLDAYNLYKKAGDWRQNLGQSIMDKFNQAKSDSMQTNYVQGMQEGGSPEEVTPEMYTGMIRKMIGAFGGEEPEGMYTPEGGLTREGYANMLGADPESINIDTLSFKNPANYMFKLSGKGAQSGADVGGTTQSRGILPLKGNVLDKVMRENIADPFERMDLEMMLRKIKPEGYQNGGMAYPLQMAGGGYMPKQGIGGLIQYRKGY